MNYNNCYNYTFIPIFKYCIDEKIIEITNKLHEIEMHPDNIEYETHIIKLKNMIGKLENVKNNITIMSQQVCSHVSLILSYTYNLICINYSIY